MQENTAKCGQDVQCSVAVEHATLRALQRHGIRPDRSDWERVFLDIVEGRAIRTRVLTHQQEASEVYWVHLCGRDVHVIYRPAQALIITVLSDGGLPFKYSLNYRLGLPPRHSRRRSRWRHPVSVDTED